MIFAVLIVGAFDIATVRAAATSTPVGDDAEADIGTVGSQYRGVAVGQAVGSIDHDNWWIRYAFSNFDYRRLAEGEVAGNPDVTMNRDSTFMRNRDVAVDFGIGRPRANCSVTGAASVGIIAASGRSDCGFLSISIVSRQVCKRWITGS